MLVREVTDRLIVISGVICMDKTIDEIRLTKESEAIDDYFECTTFCSIDESLSDCQTICMERFLKGNYF